MTRQKKALDPKEHPLNKRVRRELFSSLLFTVLVTVIMLLLKFFIF
ncbi:hypothetical protein GCM10011391_39110 [Pullulanibacillus camelliae]|uniref:Uncharacterized protein n=1 Tax=Pullulanibacillus camelliae TaxID=1707096 RepID=A0A8J2YNU8_9BACL|nr:hypothetical protein [Pullulanibacillus camelliae]GGE56310.1 hypothetical protein GCM10011391_39110 [Pullulanibacillus camelliae]